MQNMSSIIRAIIDYNCICVFLCVIRLRKEGYTVQVNVNDYLDIYCPHYNSSQRGVAEQYVLYMVSYRGYRTCDPQLGFKRWECNRPHAPHAPIKFSEKFQRYSAFSLGYEFHVGQEYYYICEYIVCFISAIHDSKSLVTQLFTLLYYSIWMSGNLSRTSKRKK